MSWNEANKLLVTLDKDRTRILWNTDSGRKLMTFRDSVGWGVALSGDGKWLATPSSVWDTRIGEKKKINVRGADSICLNGDGTRLITGGSGRAVLWDTDSGKELQTFKGHTSDVYAVCLSKDGQRLVTGSFDYTASLWDTAIGKKLQIFKGHTGGVLRVAFSHDEKRVVTIAWDGTMRLWDVASGRELCNLISVDRGNEWLAVTPDGYFDGSENGARFVSLRIAGTVDFVPLERYRKQFERPGLVARIMQGEEFRSQDVKQDLPPVVRISSPAKSGLEVKDGRITVEAETETRGEYPVTSLRLLVNGRPYPKKLGVVEVVAPKPGKTTARWEIDLEPGRHSLEVLAHTRAVFARSDAVEVLYVRGDAKPPVAVPTLYVFAVGISKYAAPEDRLDYAHRDAEAVARAYQTHSRSLFNKIEVKVLTDERSTRNDIMDGLDWLRRSMTQRDFGVFFFAGHGVKDQRDKLYFLPVDADKDKLARSAIDGDVLAGELTSTVGQLTVILDACHSGAIGSDKFRGLTDGLLRDLTSEDKGIAMMCSASRREKAQESREHEHGMFTVALLEGLSAKGNGKTGKDAISLKLTDGAVYFRQLDAYVTERVRELSRGYQHPVTSIPRAFRDFPVSQP